jgi:putative membrane protein
MIRNFAEHAANERTFLAWVRTVVAVIGFGLVAARIGPGGTALWSEALMFGAGGVVLFVVFLRMRHLRRRIDASDAVDDAAGPVDALLLLTVAAMVGLLAVFAIHVQ